MVWCIQSCLKLTLHAVNNSPHDVMQTVIIVASHMGQQSTQTNLEHEHMKLLLDMRLDATSS